MKTSILIFIILSSMVFTSCSLLGSGGKDDSDRPDIPGKIVFAAKDNAGISQIFVMQANGADLKQLTHEGQNDGPSGASQPSWSPDGRRIIYSSFTMSNSVSHQALKVMNADGSNNHVLFQGSSYHPLWGNNARWSPDGTKVAYDLCPNCQLRPNNEIYVFDTTTKTHDKLTQSTASDLNPAWSPDGTRLAYVSDKNEGTDIYIVDSKGNNNIRLTNTGNAGRQLWYKENNLIYWSKNKLYRLNLKTMESSRISVSVNRNIGFRPLSVSNDGNLILLLVFNYENNQDKRSLQILDLRNNKNSLVKIYAKTGLGNADWYVKNK